MIYHVNSLQKRNYNVDKWLKGNSTHKTLPFPNKMTSCSLTVHFSYFHGWPHINLTVTVILMYKLMIQSCIIQLKQTNDVLLSALFSELSKNIRVSVCKRHIVLSLSASEREQLCFPFCSSWLPLSTTSNRINLSCCSHERLLLYIIIGYSLNLQTNQIHYQQQFKGVPNLKMT